MKSIKRLIMASAMLGVAALNASNVHATEFELDSLLVSTNDVIYEYSRLGALRQQFAVPYPGGAPGTEYARDVSVAPNGDAVVYNGTFTPYVSSLTPTTGDWVHQITTGFSTVNNISYGGIATRANFAFATDMSTAGAGSPNGVVRFNRADNTSTRFATNVEPIDLNIGQDQLLYVLSPGGSPEGRRLDVYNPDTLQFIRTVDLENIFGFTGHRSIAVNAAGEIYIADWDGDVQRISSDGTLLGSIDLAGIAQSSNLIDIDVAPDGTVAVADRDGGITLIDSALTSTSGFVVGNNDVFVAFIPEPSTGLCLLIASTLALLPRRRASK